MNTLVLHKGARLVTREKLAAIPVPANTDTWFPLGHAQVLDIAIEALAQAGFEVARMQLALTRDLARFFATLDLRTPIITGVKLAVGIRNSTDRSLPVALCIGSRVFVCDNLGFSSQIIIARKHTKYGERRFREAIGRAVRSLPQYRDVEESRIRRFQFTYLAPDAADALLLRAFESGAVNASVLPHVIKEWRHPSFEDFEPRTLWSLFNAITTALGEQQKVDPQRFASITIQLHEFLDGVGQPSLFREIAA